MQYRCPGVRTSGLASQYDPDELRMNIVSSATAIADQNVSDMDLEQEKHRPYAYVARARYRGLGPVGMAVVDLSDPANPTKITDWIIENSDLHVGGARDVKHRQALRTPLLSYRVDTFEGAPFDPPYAHALPR